MTYQNINRMRCMMCQNSIRKTTSLFKSLVYVARQLNNCAFCLNQVKNKTTSGALVNMLLFLLLLYKYLRKGKQHGIVHENLT